MKRRSKTIAQQCRYYEVDNIFEYMVSVYLNGNISAFGELYKELNRKDKKEFILYLFSEVKPIYIQEIILTTIRFYQDRKVTCWERTHFEVTAENYEEAVALVKSWQGEDVLCFEDDEKIIITDGETLYDTSESLSVEENGGKPTIEVFADNGEDIINNTTR